MATVVIEAAAQVEFDALPLSIRVRLENLFVRLRNWPAVSGAKPLRGKLAGRFRLRTGDYRIQFHVVGNVVAVEKIGHRDGFYGE